MAMLINDNPVRCPKCGKSTMVKEDVGIFEPSLSNKNVYIETPVYQQLRCANCGEITLKIEVSGDKKIECANPFR